MAKDLIIFVLPGLKLSLEQILSIAAALLRLQRSRAPNVIVWAHIPLDKYEALDTEARNIKPQI